MAQDHLYRVRFVNQDKVYEIYAKSVYQGDLYGFVIVEELWWWSILLKKN